MYFYRSKLVSVHADTNGRVKNVVVRSEFTENIYCCLFSDPLDNVLPLDARELW